MSKRAKLLVLLIVSALGITSAAAVWGTRLSFYAFKFVFGVKSNPCAPAIKAYLSAMRSALNIYQSDHKTYPTEIYSPAFYGRYFFESNLLPRNVRPGLPPEQHFWPSKAIRSEPRRISLDSGQWVYINNPESPEFGVFYLDCTHQDYAGRTWSSY